MALRRALVALTVAGVALVADVPAGAEPAQMDDTASRPQGGSSWVQVPIEIDVQKAMEGDVELAISDIRANVQAQLDLVAQAQRELLLAEQDVLVAGAAVAETQDAIDMLVGSSDEVVIDAFINPPRTDAIDVLSTTSIEDVALKQALLDMQAVEAADVLAELEERQSELEERQEGEAAARAEADERRADARAALTDLEAAVDQRTGFVLEVEERLEHALAEAASVEAIDPELADELRMQHAALAQRIDAFREEIALEGAGVPRMGEDFVAGPSTIQPVAGGVVGVSCPSGGSIQVAGAIARDVQSLLNLSDQQGLSMCGNGYRDPQQQVEMRRTNCGSSNYAIYQAPASACSPATARPGQSLHERGLAIDFTCGGRILYGGDPCYDFLSVHAGDHGLYVLAGEPWHWSSDGT